MPTTNINLTGQAAASVNDTNVTLTLGGTPATALLKGVSFTMGWTGTLADSRIASAATWNAKESALTFGTGLSRSVNTVTIDSTVVTLTGSQALSNKTGLISQWTNDSGYLTSLSGTVTSVSGTLNRVTSTGGSTPIIDIDVNYVGQSSITTLGTIGAGVWQGTIIGKAYGGTGVNIATTALTLGTASSAVGSIVLQNATNANTITIQSGVTTSSHTLTLPVANASGVLTNNGSGTLTWAAASSGLTINSTTITSGTAYRILFESSPAGTLTNLSGFAMGSVNAGFLEVPTGYSINGSVMLRRALNGICIGNNNASGDYNTTIGLAGSSLTGGSIANQLIGNGAGYNITDGDYNICIGQLTGGTNTSNSICIGSYTTCNVNNTFVMGGNTASGTWITDVFIGSGITDTTPKSVTYHATHGSGTNVAGANMTLDGGNATGNAVGGNLKITTSVKGASGTTLQTSGDRVAVIGKYVDLTAATATAFCRINIPTSTTAGGFIIATVEANDGTDYQARTFYISWSAANKAGTTTVGLDVPHEIVAATSGTLTGTMTLVDSGSGNIDFKMDASSSLAETTLRISFQVFKNFGTGAISSI